MKSKAEPKTIREIMPEGFSAILSKACRTNASNVSQVIRLEKTTSKYWPEIEKLALATDPQAYYERIDFLKSLESHSIAA